MNDSVCQCMYIFSCLTIDKCHILKLNFKDCSLTANYIYMKLRLKMKWIKQPNGVLIITSDLSNNDIINNELFEFKSSSTIFL